MNKQPKVDGFARALLLQIIPALLHYEEEFTPLKLMK